MGDANQKTIQKTEARLEGNATERAMFKFLQNCGNLDMSDVNKNQKLHDNLIFTSPFESESKTSTTVYRAED
jgi:magnesium-transporting ATPase (P-type)